MKKIFILFVISFLSCVVNAQIRSNVLVNIANCADVSLFTVSQPLILCQADNKLYVWNGTAYQSVSGTISGSGVANNLAYFSGASTINSISQVFWNGTYFTFQYSRLRILDSDLSHGLIISPGSNLTSDRNLYIATGDADINLTIARKWVGLVSQSITSNPTVSQVFESDIGLLTFTRTGTGVYTITGASFPFSIAKTAVTIGNPVQKITGATISTASIVRTDNTTLTITTRSSDTATITTAGHPLSDGILQDTLITILIYP